VAKKIVIGVVIVFVMAIGGAFVWVRSVFAQENVRVALAAQLSKAIGQPVTVGSVTAAIYPRITVRLNEVGVGNPVRVHIRALDLGTDFRALLSRRIEHATMHLNGARIELPLPPFEITSSTVPASEPRRAPVELVSIDEIVLNDVEIVSGGRALRGDVEVVPHGKGMTLRKIALDADDTSITATGDITDLSGPTGELHIKAGALNIDKLLAFANEFSAGTGIAAAPAAHSTPAGVMNIAVSLQADRATMGAMVVEKLTSRAVLKGQELTLDPLAFGVFGGSYAGTIVVSMGSSVPSFRWRAALAGIDVAAATAFAGTPNVVSGRLSGQIDLAGRGVDAATAIKTARGSARIAVANGIVKDLGLVRAVMAATSLDANAVKQAARESRDEPFTRLGATLAIANGTATTDDLRFESLDLTLAATGSARLDGSAINLEGDLQLSEALTKQAGSGGVLRVAQEKGRLTVPATVTGSAAAPRVRIDAAAMARRALRNTAAEQGEKLLKGGLGGLIRRR
jgi:uncharacterized protein involved in outer membrane biogenesis